MTDGGGKRLGNHWRLLTGHCTHFYFYFLLFTFYFLIFSCLLFTFYFILLTFYTALENAMMLPVLKCSDI